MGKTRLASVNREQRAAYGPLIRDARKGLGLDQATLAEMTGISRRTIGSIERGDTVAQQEVLDRLLKVLNLEQADVDPDVEALLSVIQPLLQQVDQSRREHLWNWVINAVALEVRASRALEDRVEWSMEDIRKAASPIELKVMDRVGKRLMSDPAPTVADAIAAHEDGSIAGEQESTNET